MQILHVIIGLDIGGAEMMLSRLIDGNRHPGEQHAVVSLTTVGAVGSQLQAQGVPVTALGLRGLAGVPTCLLKLRRLIAERRPDVVQTWMYHADFIGGLAARLAGGCHIVWGVRTTHVGMEGSRATSLLRRVCALLSRHVPDTIVCAAEASRRAHVDVGYDPRRMHVIPNGFDTQALEAAAARRADQRAALGLPPDALVIGTAGRFNPVKDFGNFIRAAGIVAREVPSARFVLAGRHLDAHNEALVGWIAAEGLADRFSLLGERRDLPACLAALDVYCLTSRSEGFPNVLGEAMGVGLPCVSTDVGDAALLLGDTGLLVPKEDSPSLAAAVLDLLRRPPAARRALGLAAQERLQRHFSIDAARARFVELYRAVAK